MIAFAIALFNTVPDFHSVIIYFSRIKKFQSLTTFALAISFSILAWRIGNCQEHLSYTEHDTDGDILAKYVYIILQTTTYFEVLGWNQGGNRRWICRFLFTSHYSWS